MQAEVQVNFRAPIAVKMRLRQLAKQSGYSESEVLRQLIAHAEVAQEPKLATAAVVAKPEGSGDVN